MRTMLITGASTGIGAETARIAAENGFQVVLAARDLRKLEKLADEIGRSRSLAVRCDVTSYEDQQQMVNAALDRFGRIDVAFANAGIGATAMGTERGDPDNWKAMILTNVYGCALTAKVTIPELKRRKGHLLLTGSRAGRVSLKGSVYGATKWAVTGYGQNLREELADSGVRVTLVEPGMVDTPFFDSPKTDAMSAADVARSVLYAVSQPACVNVSEILIVPNPGGRE